MPSKNCQTECSLQAICFQRDVFPNCHGDNRIYNMLPKLGKGNKYMFRVFLVSHIANDSLCLKYCFTVVLMC